MSNETKIKWLIYHEPIGLFLRTANAFCDEIKNLTNGRVQIEVYTLSEYADKHKEDANTSPVELLSSGKVQMCQLYTNRFGNIITDFYALAMPFLFKDHDHAARVLEGEIGKKFLDADLPNKANLRGLAFTYSGGYCVMASKKQILSAEDLKGLTIGIVGNPVFADMAKAFGSDFELLADADHKNLAAISAAKTDTVQTTLARYNVEADNSTHKHVTNTQHTLYLTTIVMNEDFWSSLSIEDQLLIKEAALNSARKERQWSIEDNENISNSENEQKKLGITSFNDFPKEEADKLRSSLEPLYKKYTSFFSTGLIDSIKNS
jgi:TRAP-type C4-dicarboxylate transport system substrate-binding protein